MNIADTDYLYNKLKNYDKKDIYPFHMPGHKRNRAYEMTDPVSFDITEITGFDNLHHPEDVLLYEQDYISKIYGSFKSYYLVNGSSCGILTAISAAIKKGGKLLMCRNAHRSAYNAAYMRELHIKYLDNKVTELGMPYPVTPESVKEALENDSEIEAVFITSPTYEGLVADIKAISEIVHQKNIPLIVDEAHGAHFVLDEFFPESAISLGADIVIESVHKTMAALTQTALLHVGNNASRYVDLKKIERFLSIYQTSSPSYVLMGSISKCMHSINQREITSFVDNLIAFYNKCAKFQHVKLYQILSSNDGLNQYVYQDLSKIVIYIKNYLLSGQEIFNFLREKHKLECEMASNQYVLAMTTYGDTSDGFDRLYLALENLDFMISNKIEENKMLEKNNAEYKERICENNSIQKIEKYESNQFPEVALTIAEAMDCCNVEKKKLEDSIGSISAEYIYCYPPGTPIIVPGERIRKNEITYITRCKKEGLKVQGTEDYAVNNINVIKME